MAPADINLAPRASATSTCDYTPTESIIIRKIQYIPRCPKKDAQIQFWYSTTLRSPKTYVYFSRFFPTSQSVCSSPTSP